MTRECYWLLRVMTRASLPSGAPRCSPKARLDQITRAALRFPLRFCCSASLFTIFLFACPLILVSVLPSLRSLTYFNSSVSPSVVWSDIMREVKLGTLHAFGAQKRSTKLVRTAKKAV